MSVRLAFALAVAAGTLAASAMVVASEREEPSVGATRAETPTFNRDIAPIVFANCSVCHRPGEAGPFSLLSYADVKSRAPQIGEVTEMRYMPPWLPEPGKGSFKGERRLTDAQIDLIRRWVEGGTPEGDPTERPSPPRFPEGWPLGEPDLVLKTARPFPLSADGTDVFWNLVYRSPTQETRYVRAVEIRLPDRKVGHHANLLLDRTQASRRLDGRTGVVGFPGMDLALESEGFDPDSHFTFWKPGTVPEPEPKGMSWRLDRDTDLVLNLHLRPSGKPERVAPLIGLYFTDEAPTLRPMLLQLEHDGAIDVPPDTKDVTITDELVLPVAVDVLALYPHAHYLGKEIEGTATLPDGKVRWLIHIKDWDVNWQAVYRLVEPLFLPAGTTVKMRWSYDNTEDNVRNPSRPSRRVRAGNRAEDEMGHLWLQVLPRSASPPPPSASASDRPGAAPSSSGLPAADDPRLRLQEAVMRRRIEKYPADFTAHYNLGAALQAQGRLDDAVAELREAVKLGPAKATAHTTLGAALQAQGKSDEALGEFRAAIRADPSYASAQYNLGQVLLARGRTEEALGRFREALRLKPDDAEAHAQLGAALQKADHPKEALEHYRRALALDPGVANARFNVAQLLIQQGQAEAGAAELEEALRRDPDDLDARVARGVALGALGRTADAVRELREALRRAPDDLRAHDALGQLLLGQGQVDDAIPHLRRVVDSRTDDADACNNLGSALAMKGDLGGALALFERAVAIDPSHETARANLERARAAKPR